MFRKNSGIENFQAKEGGSFTVLSKFFYLTGPKKLRLGTILCFRKFLVGKNILWIRGGGVSRFSVEKFLSHCTKIFHLRTLWCFRNFLSKIFMHRRVGIAVLSKFFVSQDRSEKLCKGTLLFSRKFLVPKKNSWIRGGISRFSVENFLSHSAQKIRRGTLSCFTNFGYRKSLDKRGGSIKIFRRKFFVSQCQKFP